MVGGGLVMKATVSTIGKSGLPARPSQRTRQAAQLSTDVAFQLFNDELLFADDRLHEITDGNYAD